MKILKYSLYSVVALLLLIVLAAVALLLWFNPNDYKSNLQKLVRERTGRELTLKGDLKLSLYPWVALELGEASLGNGTGFGAAPMLELKHARLGVKLRPLFSKRVEIGKVELDGLTAHLAVDHDGHDNWSDLLKSRTEPAATPTGSGNVSASIASVRLRDTTFTYDDAKADTHLAFTALRLGTGRLVPGQPFELQTDFTFALDRTLQAKVAIEGRASVDAEQQRYALASPAITLHLLADSLPKAGVDAELHAASLNVDLNAQTLDLPELRLAVLGLDVRGAVKGEKIIDAPRFSGPVAVSQFNPRELLGKLGIELPVTTDAAALKSAQFSGQLAATTSSLNLGQLKLKLDGSNITGTAGIADFERTALRFDLNIDQIDIDRYLPPTPPAAQAAPAAPAAAAQGPLFALPVEVLRPLNARGTVAIAQASFAKVQYQQLRVGINAGGGRLRIFPAEARMYGGQYRGDIGLDVSAAQPRITLDEHVSGIDFAALCKDLFDTQRISGRGNANVKATATGRDSDQLVRTLSGTIDFKADDGAFEKLDIWYEILRARAVLKRQSLPERTGPERTAFTRLDAAGNLINGVIKFDALNATTARLQIKGAGDADIGRNALDIRLTAGVQSFATGTPEAEEVGDLAGFAVPVRISGALTDPKIRPDLGDIAKARVQQELDKHKQEIEAKKQELKDKLKDKLQDKLKGLFGN